MKPFNYLTENIWVWAGTALVLITLSGKTKSWALGITAIAVVIHLITTFLKGEDE